MAVSRKYEATHPWISFDIDLRRLPHTYWLELGEAASKCEHLAGVPLQPATANELHTLSLAKGALATTAIEGNTLTEQEVLDHLAGKSKIPPSREYLAREIDNIVNACNDILHEVGDKGARRIFVERICRYNKAVLASLDCESGVTPGRIRSHEVTVAKYRGAPAEDCSFLLHRMCEWLYERGLDGLPRIAAAIIRATLAHLYIAWIHPFGDGNGRTARLVEFDILISAGVPSPAAHLLSNHYNSTRTEYYRQLRLASESGGNPLPFMIYAVSGLVDGLRQQIELIKQQQLSVAWENFVHGEFRNRNKPAHTRQRHLVLDLSAKERPVSTKMLRSMTPRLAEAYAQKTGKTLTRDLNQLEKMNLVKETPEGWIACKFRIEAFLPIAAGGDDSKNMQPWLLPPDLS